MFGVEHGIGSGEAAGVLGGARGGNAWAVPRESVDARRRVSNGRDRPLNAARAWESVFDGAVDMSNVSRYRNRGDRTSPPAQQIRRLVRPQRLLD